MDFSKLSSNDKLAVYGAGLAIIGPIVSAVTFGFGVGWLTLLLAVAMLAIVFLPQWSPQTQLPGSKGSLMLIVGGIAGVSALLALLSVLPALGILGVYGGGWLIGMLIGIAGGLLMGWASWQAFQAEGGKFTVGTTPAGTSATPPPAQSAAAAPPPPAAAPPPPAAAAPPPASTAPPPSATPPTEDRDENLPPQG